MKSYNERINKILPNGVSVKVINAHTNAINVLQNGTCNFKVYGNGEVYARQVKVVLGNFPDYVFEKEYALMPLWQLKSYISKNKHLPGIPSAEEIRKNNLDLGEMQKLQMEKIEELTLYIIELENRINDIKASRK